MILLHALWTADTETEDGRVRINGVSVWSGLNLEKT